MIEAVIYDWGGVFQYTDDYQPRWAWDERLGQPAGTVERVAHGIPEWRSVQRGEIVLDVYWRTVGEKLGLADDQIRQLRNDFYSGDRLNTELVAITKRLREEDVPIGLMSNNSLDLAETLADWKVEGLFDAVVISAGIGVMKPDRAAYFAILDKMGIKPSQAIFVDDFIDNVEGARAVGLETVYFKPDLDIETILRQYLSGDKA